ncbi:MAG: aldo/keto reductase [Hyphomicrobiales bacterium]|nr:aldo/keto reductase [Hyphomicrobiales bacterium]
MKQAAFCDGERVCALGMGAWMIGERGQRRKEEIAALRAGLDLGLKLIDTAEMYGEGASEDLIAEAISGRRDEAFLVSKVYPHNASAAGVVAACERSLKRLRTDRIDLYLLHWRGAVPLGETIAGFERLRKAGKIRRWGVSNFDSDDLDELVSAPGGEAVATNQILYNLTRRGVEWDVLPWARRHGIPVMAYSPIEQGRLVREPGLIDCAREHGCTPAQLALAFVLDRDGVIAIPKAANPRHVQENVAALDIAITPAIREALDALFAPPRGPSTLQML